VAFQNGNFEDGRMEKKTQNDGDSVNYESGRVEA